MAKTIHVVRSATTWVVQTSEGFLRTRYATLSAAMENGAELAAQECADMFVHDHHGRITFRLFLRSTTQRQVD